MIFGIDVSDFQGAFDMAALAAEGFDFVAIKATQGATWRGLDFTRDLAAAQGAGLLTWAYHYQSTEPATVQVANIHSMVPTSVPVALDVETGSGGLDITRDIIAGLRSIGYAVPLLYLPQWYWQQLNRPDLSGLPPLWSSKYPSTAAGAASALYQNVPSSYWSGYGGLTVMVLQFTDNAAVAGQHVDASAFGGTRAQLAGLLGGTHPTSRTSEEGVSHILLPATAEPKNKQDDPATWPTREVTIPIAQIGGWHGDAMIQVVMAPYYDHDPKTNGFVRYANWFVTPDITTTEPSPVGADEVINQNGAPFRVMWPVKWGPAPANTVSFSISYAAPNGGAIEVERQY